MKVTGKLQRAVTSAAFHPYLIHTFCPLHYNTHRVTFEFTASRFKCIIKRPAPLQFFSARDIRFLQHMSFETERPTDISPLGCNQWLRLTLASSSLGFCHWPSNNEPETNQGFSGSA